MGNKLGRRRQVVDERYTKPQGLYVHKDVDHKKLRKLILESKLAPCYPGDDDFSIDHEECPICFLDIDESNEWLIGTMEGEGEVDEDDDNDLVFENDNLTWGAVARAIGAEEDRYTTRSKSVASSSSSNAKEKENSKATPRVRSKLVIDEEDDEYEEEVGVENDSEDYGEDDIDLEEDDDLDLDGDG